MRELADKIWQQLRGTWRFRWVAFVMVWLISIGGWTLVYLMPNIYQAQTQVYVDTDSILRPLLAGLTVQNNLENHVRMMRLALLSRPNLEEVARKTDLTLQAQGPTQMDAIVQRLRHKISIENRRNGNLYTISYKDSDREQAKTVVQSLLNIFMENSLSSNQSDNAGARKFLKNQLDDYKKKLDTAEQNLANFKKNHVGEMPNQGQDYFDRLQSALSTVQDTETQLKVAQQRRNELQQSASGEQPTFAFTPPTPVQQSDQSETDQNTQRIASESPLQKRIKSLRMKLDNMLLQYTNQYPGVIQLKQQIAMLQKQVEKQPKRRIVRIHRSTRAPARPPSGIGTDQARQLQLNPVYQDTLMSLNSAKADVAALKAQLQQQKKHVSQLRSKINVIPEVEAQLSSLTRNYSVMKDRYDKLLQRYEEAQLANTANTATDQVKFRVINPPFVNPKPVGPKRGRYLVVVFLFAFVAAGGFAFFLHQMRPVFMDAQQLRQVTGLHVVGSVSRVWSNRSRTAVAISLMSFSGGLAALILAFVVAFIFKNSGSQMLRDAIQGLL